MIFNVFTLFPSMFVTFEEGIIARAKEKGVIKINLVDIRDFTTDKHRKVDDQPFGGGPGMVMEAGPVFLAVESTLGAQTEELKARGETIILLTPQGRKFDYAMARDLSDKKEVSLICGHYEGLDERVGEHLASDELSIGDYVLSGGELAAMVVIEAVSRFIPGVVGKEESVTLDSYECGLLKHPQYTRPRKFRNWEVPEVLLSGDHARIEEWRRRKAIEKTACVRPDLLEKAKLSEKERELAEQVIKDTIRD